MENFSAEISSIAGYGIAAGAAVAVIVLGGIVVYKLICKFLGLDNIEKRYGGEYSRRDMR